MNAVTSIWREMMRRRLWPVALLLVAAMAAVPVLLTRDAQPVAAPIDSAPAVSAKADDTIAEPVVAKVEATDRPRRRRVLGARKDPFAPAPVKQPKKAKTADAKPDDTNTTPTSSAPKAPSGPVATPAPKPVAHPAGSLVIRFGDAEADVLPRTVLRKLNALPDDETQLIVFLGLTSNGKKAKFLVDDALEVTGDGTCKPHVASCETIELAAGETEFFDVIDPENGEVLASWELDLLRINR